MYATATIDFRQALQDKIETITENSIEAVRSDEQIGTTKQLTYDSVRHSLRIVLNTLPLISFYLQKTNEIQSDSIVLY